MFPLNLMQKVAAYYTKIKYTKKPTFYDNHLPNCNELLKQSTYSIN